MWSTTTRRVSIATLAVALLGCSAVDQLFPDKTKKKKSVPAPAPFEIGVFTTFVLKQIPDASVEDLQPKTAQVLNDDTFYIYNSDSSSWRLTNNTWAITPRSPLLAPSDETSKYFQIDSGSVWVLQGKKVTFGTVDVVSGTITGPTVELPAQSPTLQVIGADDSSMYVYDETNTRMLYRIVAPSGSSLSLQKHDMTSSVRNDEGEWSAGSINSDTFWLWTKEKLRIVTNDNTNSTAKISIYRNPIFIENQGDKVVRKVALRITKTETTLALKGPIIALVGEHQMYASAAATEYQWTDVQPRLQNACVPCHATYADQAEFVANKTKIIARMTSDDNTIKMPPPASSQAQALSALDRQIILDWLQ